METITREWLKRPLKAYDKHHVSLSQIWSHSNSLVSNNKPVRPSSDHAQGENTSKTSEASLLSVVYISLQNVMEIYRSIGWKSKAWCILNMVTKTTRRFACCLPPATHHSPNLRLLWTLDNTKRALNQQKGWLGPYHSRLTNLHWLEWICRPRFSEKTWFFVYIAVFSDIHSDLPANDIYV